jgi:hypothetical protein
METRALAVTASHANEQSATRLPEKQPRRITFKAADEPTAMVPGIPGVGPWPEATRPGLLVRPA